MLFCLVGRFSDSCFSIPGTAKECSPVYDDSVMFQDGATPLFLAAQEGHVTVIRQLLSSGAKVNQAREVMSSPL